MAEPPVPDIITTTTTITTSQGNTLGVGVSLCQLLVCFLSKSVAVMLSKHRSASVQPIHHSPLGTQQTHIWLQAPLPLQNCNPRILTISIFNDPTRQHF